MINNIEGGFKHKTDNDDVIHFSKIFGLKMINGKEAEIRLIRANYSISKEKIEHTRRLDKVNLQGIPYLKIYLKF